MVFRMMAIATHVMLDRDADTLLHSCRITKRFAAETASMIFGQPDVWHTFFFRVFGRIMLATSLIQRFAMPCSFSQNRQTPLNSRNMLRRPSLKPFNHFQRWFCS
jgi:hypothetical protein